MTPAPSVLFLASEIVPYAKTGGLADVAGALPGALRHRGVPVVSMMPLYGSVDRSGLLHRPEWSGRVELGPAVCDWTIWEDPAGHTRFVDVPALFERDGLYTHDWDEHLRFAVFCNAALDHAVASKMRPDVIHANDWQMGLIPALVAGPYAERLGHPVTVFTIHNLAHQGRFDASVADSLGLGEHVGLLHGDHLRDGYVSFLETALLHANWITTVSPTYAHEIQTPAGGAGLDELLRNRSGRLVGILNGIDVHEWNPRTDPHIPAHYSVRSLWRKELDKEALLRKFGLEYRKHVPVIGMVTRLAQQKGIDLIELPFRHFLETWDVRFALIGSGEQQHEQMLRRLASDHPDKVGFFAGYDNALTHLVEAGSDIFLMPSLYEPCGLNQMYSLAYGTIPVVRRVGGLADTVEQADVSIGAGTGVVFDHYDSNAVGWALGRALTMHLDRRGWQTLQRNGMAIDNSWDERAQEYLELYRRAVET
jgi:starch synthase